MFTLIGNLLIESPPGCESLVKLIMEENVYLIINAKSSGLLEVLPEENLEKHGVR